MARAAVTEDMVMTALRAIKGPDGQSIEDIATISGLQIRDGHVGFSLEVEPKEGPKLESVRKAAEDAVAAIPDVLSSTAVLTAHRGKAEPQEAPQKQKPAPGVKHIVAVASGKGGVGKSTTAANLALALAAEGRSVGVLDADIYGPSMPRMLGVSGRPEAPNGKDLRPMEGYGLKIMSMGFLVDEETPMIWRGPMVMSAITQMLENVMWGDLDVLIVDMPPGTGDAQLTLSQQTPLAGAVIVSTPQDIALLDARKGLNMFRKVDVPVLGIIENMSFFVCPNCGERSEIFSHGGARKEAEKLGVPCLAEVPLHLDIRETADGGRPVVVSKPDGPHAQIYRSIARQVWERLDGGSASRAAPKILVT